MTDLRTAAQQALEAMRCAVPTGKITLYEWDKAVSDLDAALAEPVQGPVAWRTFDGEGGYDYRTYEDNEDYAAEWAKRNPRHVGWVEPLYAAPHQPPAEPVHEPVATMTVREDMGADFKFNRAHTLQPGQQFYLYATPLAEEHPCNTHPKAPHGFMRNASHTEDRYVCECEAWDPWEAGYQAGMESAMRMEAESAHILGANPDSSQDTGRAP